MDVFFLFSVSSMVMAILLAWRQWKGAATTTFSRLSEPVFFFVWLTVHAIYGAIRALRTIHLEFLRTFNIAAESKVRGVKVPKHLALFLTSPAYVEDIPGVVRIVRSVSRHPILQSLLN